jgi:hypothetical protein
MKEEWVTGAREQCKTAGVPFFFKPWGGVRKSEAGRELEGRTYNEMPERKPFRVPAHKIRVAMIEEVRRWAVVYDLPEMTIRPASGVDCQPLLF